MSTIHLICKYEVWGHRGIQGGRRIKPLPMQVNLWGKKVNSRGERWLRRPLWEDLKKKKKISRPPMTELWIRLCVKSHTRIRRWAYSYNIYPVVHFWLAEILNARFFHPHIVRSSYLIFCKWKYSFLFGYSQKGRRLAMPVDFENIPSLKVGICLYTMRNYVFSLLCR